MPASSPYRVKRERNAVWGSTCRDPNTGGEWAAKHSVNSDMGGTGNDGRGGTSRFFWLALFGGIGALIGLTAVRISNSGSSDPGELERGWRHPSRDRRPAPAPSYADRQRPIHRRTSANIRRTDPAGALSTVGFKRLDGCAGVEASGPSSLSAIFPSPQRLPRLWFRQ